MKDPQVRGWLAREGQSEMNERFDDGRFREPRGALARFRHPVHYTARTAAPQTPLPTYRSPRQSWRNGVGHESWVGNPPPGTPNGSISPRTELFGATWPDDSSPEKMAVWDRQASWTGDASELRRDAAPELRRQPKSPRESRDVAETATLPGRPWQLIRSGGRALAEFVPPGTRVARKRGSPAQTPPP